MANVVIKRKRYLTGHSYATGLGTSFSWSADIEGACRFSDDDMYAKQLAQRSGGVVVPVANTREEAKALRKSRARTALERVAMAPRAGLSGVPRLPG